MTDQTGTTTGTGSQGDPADGQGTTGAQGAADGGAGSQGDPAGGQAQGAGAATTGQPDGSGLTPAELAARVTEREAENARYRARIRELEAAEAERTRAGMTEAERMTTELAEATSRATAAETALAERAYGDDVAGIASRLGFRDPLDAAAFVQRATVLGADGQVDNAKLTDKLKATLKAKPYLGTGGAGGDGGAGRERQPSGSSFNDEIRNRVRR